MKKSVIALLLLCLKLPAYSQTLATDFNVTDCSGTPHHLFNELDSGKIVVLCFVMPCSGCVNPVLTTHNVVRNILYTHSNVAMYIVDDEGNDNCSVLSSWESSNYFWTVPKISDASAVQDQYGSPGMPKIVVLGGAGHYVYDIERDMADSTQLNNAINAALSGVVPAPMPNSVLQPRSFSSILLSPNPAGNLVNLTCDLQAAGDVRMDIFDATGTYVKTVIKEGQRAGKHTFTIETATLSNGNYFLKLHTGDAVQAVKFAISK